MILVVRQWYGARTRREQRLILLMVAIAAPLLAGLLVVMPLERAYNDALERHLEAIDRNGRVRQLAETSTARPAVAPGAGGADLPLVIAESAARAGLTLDSNGAAGPNSASVAIAGAPAPTAVQWLRDLETRGVAVEDVRLTPAANGTVAVSARLARGRR